MTHVTAETEPLLTAEDEGRLAGAIEAGVLAGGLLAGVGAAGLAPLGGSDVTDAELRLVQAEGDRAWRRFVQANLGLVRLFAGREARRCQLPEAELFQEGCLALMVALQRFDHRRGVRFSTYAVPWVKAAVNLAGARRCGEMELSAWRAGAMRQVRATESRLAVDLGRMPSAGELGVVLDRGAGWVEALLGCQPNRSLDAEGSVIEVADAAGEQELDRVLTAGSGLRLLDRLPAVEREVIAVRFGFVDGQSHSVRESAALLGMGRKGLRAVEVRALRRLRRELSESAAA